MSKRPGAVSAETKEMLLTAARDEFYKRGFSASSLRQICSSAGVTTGALYFFFDNKDDIFKSVISTVTEPFMRFINEHYNIEDRANNKTNQQDVTDDFAVSAKLIDLYFENQKTWDIILKHLNHPAIKDFIDEFIDVSVEHYKHELTNANENIKIEEFALHQYVHMQVDSMLTLISHDFTKQEMTEHAKTSIIMLRGAFFALLNKR